MEEIDESSRQAGERAAFSRLCESIKDLPPKEQVSRVHEYFGIFGGAPPPKGQGPGRYVASYGAQHNTVGGL